MGNVVNKACCFRLIHSCGKIVLKFLKVMAFVHQEGISLPTSTCCHDTQSNEQLGVVKHVTHNMPPVEFHNCLDTAIDQDDCLQRNVFQQQTTSPARHSSWRRSGPSTTLPGRQHTNKEETVTVVAQVHTIPYRKEPKYV